MIYQGVYYAKCVCVGVCVRFKAYCVCVCVCCLLFILYYIIQHLIFESVHHI